MFEIIDSPATRLPCPKDLTTKAEKAIWADVIGSYGPDYFNPGDLPLIVQFVRMKVLSDKYYRKLKSMGDLVEDNNGRVTANPYFKMLREAAATMTVCATKLRISPIGRVRPEDAKQSNRIAKDGKVFNPKSEDWRDHQKLDG